MNWRLARTGHRTQPAEQTQHEHSTGTAQTQHAPATGHELEPVGQLHQHVHLGTEEVAGGGIIREKWAGKWEVGQT